MSLKDIPLSNQDRARAQLSSVWSCSCEAPIRDIVISAHGVVGVVADSSIYLYAGAPSFGVPHTLSLSPARLTAYHFSADGTHFLTGDSLGFVKWWEVHSGEESSKAPFRLPKSPEAGSEGLSISSIVCSAETDLVAVAAGNMVCIYGHGGLRLHSIGPLDSPIRSVQWNKPTELAVNIGTAICMIFVTPGTFTPRQKYPSELKEGDLKTLACSPRGNMFAAGCTTGLVQIWDLASESNEQISVFVKGLPNAAASDGSVRVQCLEWDASARFLAAAGGSDVIVWDMQDTNEKEEGKDNSIVCYGHGKKAKITALSFQPKGHLLATGGDDCQVLVFDSSNFTSNGVVGGLVDSIANGRVAQSHNGAAITALAWHPSGLILAGTTKGCVDAFEVSGAIYETPRVAANGHVTEIPFLIKKTDTGRKPNNQPKPSGWGGEPLIPSRTPDGGLDRMFMRRRSGAAGAINAGTRSVGRKTGVYMGNFKPLPRPYAENTGTQTGGNWPTMLPAPMMHWPAFPHQQMHPQFTPRPPSAAAPPPYTDPPSNPPRTPESNSSDGATRGVAAPIQAPPHRNERQFNRSGSVEQPPPLMPGTPPHYPMGYMPYPAPFPMGYPPQAYSYPYQVPHQIQADGMHGALPPYGAQQFGHPPINQPPKAPQLHRSVSSKTETTQKDGSQELEEDLGSKSSEATNNGVNNSVTPTQRSDASGYYQEGRPQPGQTLYVGNLAPAIEENILMQYFNCYGPVSSIQVIRDRETHVSRGYGFVTFAHPFYAQVAMQQLDSVQIGGPFEGKKLKVSFSNRR